MKNPRSLWKPIKFLLIKISHVQVAIIMGLVYFVIIGPVALLYQILHHQPKPRKSYWVKKNRIADMATYLKRQF